MDFEIRGFGYKPDRRHSFGFGEKEPYDLIGSGPVPEESDQSMFLLPALDQGGAPFCVGNSVADALRTCMVRNGAFNPETPSRLWLMYLCHALDGDTNLFDGTFIRNAFKVLVKLGFPPESAWPYDDSSDGRFRVKPDKNVFRLADDRKAPLDYRRILTVGYERVDDVKRALAAGFPVVFGTAVSNDFARNIGTTSGPIDPPTRDIAGLHALRAFAHKNDTFRIRNTWSPEWADEGNCEFSSDYIAHPSTEDVWVANFKGVRS